MINFSVIRDNQNIFILTIFFLIYLCFVLKFFSDIFIVGRIIEENYWIIEKRIVYNALIDI